MAAASQFEIKCGTCGYWMPAPVAGEGMSDGATPVGSVVQCRKCLQRTTCTSNNLRLRVEGGALA
jgi:ribosomal protein S27E